VTSLAVAAAEPGYDRVARALHWLVAALAVIAVSLGWAIGGAPRNTWTRELLLVLHRSVGLTILAAMVLRILWRWRHPPPALPPRVAALERFLAGCTHAALYVVFIAMPLAGYVNAAAAGHAVNFFGLISIPPVLPENDRVSQAAIAVHLVGQYFLYGFVLLHIAGGLMHGAVRRDGVLDRMLPPRRRR
jgi:cytochrome b561